MWFYLMPIYIVLVKICVKSSENIIHRLYAKDTPFYIRD